MPMFYLFTLALEDVSLTRGQSDELSVCLNNLFRRILTCIYSAFHGCKFVSINSVQFSSCINWNLLYRVAQKNVPNIRWCYTAVLLTDFFTLLQIYR